MYCLLPFHHLLQLQTVVDIFYQYGLKSNFALTGRAISNKGAGDFDFVCDISNQSLRTWVIPQDRQKSNDLDDIQEIWQLPV